MSSARLRETAQEKGSAEMRRWFCVRGRAGVRMRLLNVRVRIRERLLHRESDSESENEKVLV